MNSRITKKEQGLLKGAVRRVFSRSELRRASLERTSVTHSDVKRPRVKKWAYCELCGEVVPKYTLTVDHINPVIPTNSSFEEMGLDKTVDNLWCDLNNLQNLCDHCHKAKSRVESKERKEFKKGKKK